MTLTFTLADAECADPCPPGLEQARALFEPERSYTLPDVIAAGLSRDGVAWLLIHRAGDDREALRRLRRWVRSCGGRAADSVTDCMAKVRRARADQVQAAVAGGEARDAAKARIAGEHFNLMIKAFS